MSRLPLLDDLRNDSDWLIHKDGSLTSTELLSRAKAWAEVLPSRKYIILLCEHRLNFFIGFVAAQLKGQTVLLPPNRSVGAITEIASDYPDSYCLIDDEINTGDCESLNCQTLPLKPELNEPDTAIEARHVAAIVFTSGSTGKASPNSKTWGCLVQDTNLAIKRFGFGREHSIVATVPPQHMYGLETTVMLPLVAGIAVYADRPFFPEDVRQALEQCEGKRVLVTTPVHLRACVAAGLQWPTLDQVISATAPLDKILWQQAEVVFSAPIREIFGCTEAGSLASREPAKDEDWLLYESFRIFERDGCSIVTAPHLDIEEVELADVVEILSPTRFRLLGRHTDMLNIAGKRVSLIDLNKKLNAIAGVVDAVFIMPDAVPGKMIRLVALVVAPAIDESTILSSLAEQIDPVFLPRPLYRVEALPRNETGKIPRKLLLELLDKLGRKK